MYVFESYSPLPLWIYAQEWDWKTIVNHRMLIRGKKKKVSEISLEGHSGKKHFLCWLIYSGVGQELMAEKGRYRETATYWEQLDGWRSQREGSVRAGLLGGAGSQWRVQF